LYSYMGCNSRESILVALAAMLVRFGILRFATGRAEANFKILSYFAETVPSVLGRGVAPVQ